jgi:hypothetical protein
LKQLSNGTPLSCPEKWARKWAIHSGIDVPPQSI